MTTTQPTTTTDELTTYCVQATRTEYSWVYLKAHSEEEAEAQAAELDDQQWQYADFSEERTIDYAHEQEPAAWEKITEPPAPQPDSPRGKPLAEIIAEQVARGREPSETNTVERKDVAPASPSTKSIYRVAATSFSRYCIFVEANSKEEAEDIGHKVDGFYWEIEEEGDWNVDYAEEAPEVDSTELLSTKYYNTL